MKQASTSRKLTLNRETVRALDATALGAVVGGCCTGTGYQSCSCYDTTPCGPCATGTCTPNKTTVCTY